MATAAITEPIRVQEPPQTLADLLRRLGGIPARRVRLHPPPGTATEDDLLRYTWVVDPKAETVRVHQTPKKFEVLRPGEILDGGDVIPGLAIPVDDLFELEDD